MGARAGLGFAAAALASWLLLGVEVWAQSEGTPSSAGGPVVVAVLNTHTRGDELARWQPTIDELIRKLPGRRFVLRELGRVQLERAVSASQVDFVLTSSAQAVLLVDRFQARPILTAVARHGEGATSELGAIVITRADRHDLNRLSDLRGKSFAALDPMSFDGWLMARREFQDRGMDVDREIWPLLFLGEGRHVVEAVWEGRVDAGTVPWDEFEQLSMEGQAGRADFKILDVRPVAPGQPLPTSTRLYPEATLLAVRDTSPELEQEVRQALRSLAAQSPALLESRLERWGPASDLREARAALLELGLPPYEARGRTSLLRAAREHWPWFLFFALGLLGCLGLLGYLVWSNRTFQRLRSSLERELEEKARAESALRESETFYHSLVESLPQHILRKDRDGRFTFANSRFCAELGKPLEEILGKTDYDFFPRELAEKYRKDDLAVIAGGKLYDTTEQHIAPGGTPQYVQVIKSPIHDEQGELIGIQGIFWDVTERKRVEEELRQSREQFELAMRGARDGIWDWDLVRNEVYFSPRWKSMLGYEPEEISSNFAEWERLIHPDDHDRAMATVRAYLEGSLPHYEMEVRMRHKNGSYRWILTRGAALREADGRPYRMAGSHTDITNRKEVERKLSEQNRRLEELVQSEREAHEAIKSAQSRMVETAKLAGLGEMVAGVAHEINNPLAFVSNNIAVLQRDLADLETLISLYREGEVELQATRPDLIEKIWEISESIDLDYTMSNLQSILARTREGLKRIHQIVKDLRTFARVDAGEITEFDLNHGIDSTVNIVRGHAKKKDVQVKLDLGPVPAITGSAAKINQVIMNIVVNAIDASETGGVVVVRSRAEPEGVRVEVEDRGTGIDPAIRERIFDPFFTTKPVGVGTGLGLSISYGIVQDHGGRIDVDSVPGGGTTFTVHLPLMIPRRVDRPVRESDSEDGMATTPREEPAESTP
jgi:two-component system, NtrC family, sensor kinase